MVNWLDYYVHAEQQRDKQCEARLWRLTREMRLASTHSNSLWTTTLARLGGRLVVWGERLQAHGRGRRARPYYHV